MDPSHVTNPSTAERRARAEQPRTLSSIYQRLAYPLPTADILVITALNVDSYYLVRTIAPEQETRCADPESHPGGAGASFAAALGRLGASVRVAGVVGNDLEASLSIDSLRDREVDTSLILRRAIGRTGRVVILADREDRRMNIVVPGINEEYAKILFSEPEEEERLLLAASQSKIVHLSSFTGTRERRLQERIIANLPSSVVVSLAAGALYAPLEFTTLRPVLERCDLLFIYESHLRALLGARPQTALQDLLLEVSRRLADAAGLYPPVIISMQPHTGGTGLRNLIIAQYAKHEWDLYQSGAVLESPRGMVVDSSGSADAIAAAVVYAALHGCAPSECADFAYVMAMATCSALGGRDGHPSVQELSNVWHRHLPATEVPGWVQTHL